jgi:hypothetical protein
MQMGFGWWRRAWTNKLRMQAEEVAEDMNGWGIARLAIPQGGGQDKAAG